MDGEKLSDLVTEENYGDYVDYPVDLGIGADGTQDDWKIFYDNGTNIFIIAADYVPNTKISTAAGRAGMTQSGTYNNYWSSAPSEIDTNYNPDILELFSIKNSYTLTNYTSSYCVSKLLSTNYWDDFKNTTYADYAVGGPTLEMWCASWNAYLTANPNSDFKEMTADSTNNYGYYVSSDTSENQTYLYMNGTTSSLSTDLTTALQNDYSLYFPHTSSVSDCYAYWLASPSADGYDYLMRVHFGGNVYNSNYDDGDGLALRPVVSLKSNVSATYDSDNHIYNLKQN